MHFTLTLSQILYVFMLWCFSEVFSHFSNKKKYSLAVLTFGISFIVATSVLAIARVPPVTIWPLLKLLVSFMVLNSGIQSLVKKETRWGLTKGFLGLMLFIGSVSVI